MADTFVAKVKSAYRFLEDEYDFAVTFSREDRERRHYAGSVVYSSQLTLVSIGIDRGALSRPSIARVKDKEKFHWVSGLSLQRIHEYAVTTPRVRALLTSHDPQEFREGQSALEATGPASRHPSSAAKSGDFGLWLDKQLGDDARALRRYAEPFLRGDFSLWLELHEYDWLRLVAEQIVDGTRRGKGISVGEVEAKFRRSLEYLSALRREYGQG